MPERGWPRQPWLHRPPRALTLALAGVALAALFAAIGVGTTSHTSGAAATHPTLVRVEGTIAVVLICWVIVVGVALTIWALTMKGGGAPVAKRRKTRTWLLIVAAVVLSFLYRFWMNHLHPHDSTAPRLHVTLPKGQQQGAHNSLVDTDFATLGVLIAVLATIMVLVVLSTLNRRRLLREFDVADDTDEPGLLDAAVEAALADLAAEPDPRKAVIAAYARMERLLTDGGLPRRAWETPEEFLQRVLRDLGARGAAADRLTGLFEVAKFSHHEVGEDMRHEAIEALQALRTPAASGVG